MSYSIEVIAAAARVGRIFESGCDRCDAGDLRLLKDNKLMTTRRCTKADAEAQDSLEAGETMFEFTEDGDALVAAILNTQ
tara:strand:+ start:210 stop:449 length:240 start_codon:yes stop_codon:yes gene_type:complete